MSLIDVFWFGRIVPSMPWILRSIKPMKGKLLTSAGSFELPFHLDILTDTFNEVSIDSGTVEWKTLCVNIARFCLLEGCSTARSDAPSEIKALREHHTLSQLRPSEGPLQAEVTTLKSHCSIQQRIITTLSFRRILEALPEPRSTNTQGSPIPSTVQR